MIIKIFRSPKKNKRFRIYMDNGKHYDFGYKFGETYIDHKDKKKRENYLKRHLANKTEKTLIENNIPSPALFSAKLLWGNSTDLLENIYDLNSQWKH